MLSAARRAEINRANAQFSTGPRSLTGKAIVSQNNLCHGFTGSFQVLAWERQEDFNQLLASFRDEHQPANPYETVLVEKMAQHFWLSQRALRLQDECFLAPEIDQKALALFLRYQTTHDRAFHKCSDELRKLRNQRRKQEIGFESQKRREAHESRRNAAEKRRDELHRFAVLLAEAKLHHQKLLNSNVERSMSIAA